MRVAVDAHVVGERETGNETYVVNLLRALAADPAGNSYQVLTPHPDRVAAVVTLPSAFKLVRVRPAASLLRIPFAMTAAVRSQRSDVLHVSYVAPPIVSARTVVTVHDLSYLAYPRSVSARTRLITTTLVPLSVYRAAQVITPSRFTREDLVKRYRVAEEKIAVIHEAAAPSFRAEPESRGHSLPEGVADPFILAVGNLEPRKNLARLIEAFASMVRLPGCAANLVLVGQAKRRAADLVKLIERHGLQDRVVLLGFVDEKQLVLLYNRAALFVYPSLYEGFGLPPIEAMACGCPVVASNVSAIPEVLGDAALLVAPSSTAELAEAMRAILDRKDLARELRARGMRQAARYSWAQAAAQTRAVYAHASRRAVDDG